MIVSIRMASSAVRAAFFHRTRKSNYEAGRFGNQACKQTPRLLGGLLLT